MIKKTNKINKPFIRVTKKKERRYRLPVSGIKWTIKQQTSKGQEIQ